MKNKRNLRNYVIIILIAVVSLSLLGGCVPVDIETFMRDLSLNSLAAFLL